MSIGQWVMTSNEGWAEIVEVAPGRMGALQYRLVSDATNGWYSAREITSDIDEDHITTDVSSFNSDTDGSGTSTQSPDEAKDSNWLGEGTKLPWNPDSGDQWDGQLTQKFEDHDIDLSDTNSLKGHDIHPDPEDHNAIFEHRKSNKYAFDSEDTDYDEDEDYADREEGKEKKEASVGPRQAFVDYIRLIEANSLVKEAAWADVRRKAKRLYDAGDVTVEHNDGREIIARVDGDHGRYDTQVHRKNAFGKGITWYDCTCEWGKFAYKRERSFVGRLCSHGLAAYFAMQANKQPVKDVKRINNKTERHTLASAPKSTPLETESLAARNGGLMVWDDNLHKVMKEFFNKPDASMSADPASLGDPGSVGPDASSQLAADPSADAGANPVDGDFSGDNSPGITPDQFVRSAEFSKNPNTDDLFEDFDATDDDHKFNDVSERFKKDNDSEYGFYDEFWGRSSAALPIEQEFQTNLDQHNTGISEPGRNLPHFIRKKQQKITAAVEESEETPSGSNAFGVSEEDAAKFEANKFAATDTEGNADYQDHDQPADGSWQHHPNHHVNGDDSEDHQDQYQSDGWLGETNDEWIKHEIENNDREDSHFPGGKSSAFQNEADADEFNSEADAIVQAFHKSAGAQALFSDDDSGAFVTVASDMSRTAGRHFTFAEQQELIEEKGTARHLADLDLEGTFYLS